MGEFFSDNDYFFFFLSKGEFFSDDDYYECEIVIECRENRSRFSAVHVAFFLSYS